MIAEHGWRIQVQVWRGEHQDDPDELIWPFVPRIGEVVNTSSLVGRVRDVIYLDPTRLVVVYVEP